jgi:hypothetical protein
MKRFLLGGLAAGVAALGLAGPAGAHDEWRRDRDRPHGGRAYYLDHAVRFGHGFYYPGRDHHHWTRRVWDPILHRILYWDPSLHAYFYWSAPDRCFYPATYCP